MVNRDLLTVALLKLHNHCELRLKSGEYLLYVTAFHYSYL